MNTFLPMIYHQPYYYGLGTDSAKTATAIQSTDNIFTFKIRGTHITFILQLIKLL